MKKVFLIIIIVFISINLNAASVSFYIGDVKVFNKGIWKKATVNMKVSKGDIIKTGRDSFAIISFLNIGKVKLRSQSQIRISQLENKNVSLNLKSGGVFSRIIKDRNRKYIIKTYTITASVRGTQFFIAYGKKQGTNRDLWLCVNDGIVNVKENLKRKSVDVKAGEGIFIDSKGNITAPKKYRWTQKLNWNMDPNKGDIKDTTNLEKVYSDLLDQDYD